VTEIEVPVGATRTRVCLWPEAAWPPQEWLERLRSAAARTVVVFDAAVRALRGARFGDLGTAAECVPGAGEESKRWPAVEAIVETAMRHGVGRDGCFTGVGGGAICDVTAFAASLYMRGVAVELAPTTLLAMVDASVGGKTAINFRGAKNLVGTFHAARRVDILLGSLGSLPEREWKSGLAEILKAALLGEPELLELLVGRREAVLGHDPAVVAELVRRSIELKARVVAEDPTESGRRAVLNLGHTFAHALESVAGPGLLAHGQAVAWGIGRAMDLGARLGITEPAYRARVLSLLRDYGFALDAGTLLPGGGAGRAERLLEAMRQDKKKLAGGLRFVLQKRLGETEVVSGVPDPDVLAVLTHEA
jgi:3-dehydroquinate synthase